MLGSDYDIVLTHGNDLVGLDLRRAEIAHEKEGLPLTPLANTRVADTQGGIGYWSTGTRQLSQSLR